jgi:hypothetical protein
LPRADWRKDSHLQLVHPGHGGLVRSINEFAPEQEVGMFRGRTKGRQSNSRESRFVDEAVDVDVDVFQGLKINR